jgi:hypothetical protein
MKCPKARTKHPRLLACRRARNFLKKIAAYFDIPKIPALILISLILQPRSFG